MSEEEIFFDPVDSPLEFAVLAMDILLDQELTIDDQVVGDPQIYDEGFSLVCRFRDAIDLTLSYDGLSQTFSAEAVAQSPAPDVATLRLALQVNASLPDVRRFSLDPASQGLALSERWPAQGLELAVLAAGLRVLVQGLELVVTANPNGAVTPAVAMPAQARL